MNAFLKKKSGAESKVLAKREQKKNINIQWNGPLVFQLSLIGCGLLAFLIIESDIKLGMSNASAKNYEPDFSEPAMTDFVMLVDTKPVIKVPKVRRSTQRPKATPASTFTPINNDAPTVETPVAPTDGDPVIDAPTAPVRQPMGDRNMINVEVVPTFPGCEGLQTNAEKRACMQEKISVFIGKKFNIDVSDQTSGSKQRIIVQFKIATDGQITEVRARAADRALEREAKRVVEKLPDMKPGLQGNVPVNVVYSLPIVFSVN